MPIKKLSVQLANQIAAGEVVENPASVVKELLENAIDAHASVITLEVAEAGKLLIKVTDNGSGIPRDELPLALAPHATSKILELKDLEAIMTLGFRGEALASIAAVSKLSLTSNTKQQEHGYKVEVEGPDQHPYIYPAAHPVGTTVLVRELFFNTPARRRFLKSDKAELAKVRDIFNRIALVNYHCEFNLVIDGKNVLHLPVTNREGLPQRIAKLLGSEYKGPLITLDNHDPAFQATMQQLFQDEHFSLEQESFPLPPILGIHGVLLYPDVHRGLSDKLVFFLNGRCMGDKFVVRAVRDGVMQFLKGSADFKPSVRGVLFLECDPHIVDVNVHPRKDEVRFHDSNQIYNCIVTTIKTALQRYGLTADNFGQGDLGLPSDFSAPAPASTPAIGGSTAMGGDGSWGGGAAATLDSPASPAAPTVPTLSTASAAAAVSATEDSLDSDSDDTEVEIEVNPTVSLETVRETELRAKVEQYFARYPSAVRRKKESQASTDEPTATVTLRGDCCDFSRLQAGLAALTVLRQAQQAVSAFRHPTQIHGATYGRPEESLVESELESTWSAGLAEETDATKATGATGATESAWPQAAASHASPESNGHFDLNAMLWQQEWQRNQAQSRNISLSSSAPTAPTASVPSAFPATSIPPATAVPSATPATPLASALAKASAMASGNASTGATTGFAIEDSGRVIVDRARAFAQTIQMLYSCRNTRYGADVAAVQAQFLALVAPNVLLFSLQQRYFLGKGSDLLVECLAEHYAYQVQAHSVQSTALPVPFAIVVEYSLLQEVKRQDVGKALLRCGFVVQGQLRRSVVELQRIPDYLVGCNLAAVVPALLQGMAQEADAINGDMSGRESSQISMGLCLQLARAREYEINTAHDAQQLLAAICSVQQLEPLLQHGTLQELNLLQLAQQMLQH